MKRPPVFTNRCSKLQAVKMTRLSCHLFRSNQVRLLLSLIAYNLGNLWRRLVLPKKIEGWSLTRAIRTVWGLEMRAVGVPHHSRR
jgi:hypothetical protein